MIPEQEVAKRADRDPVGALERFRKAMARCTGNREVYGPAKINEVADRYKNGGAFIPGPDLHTHQFVAIQNGSGSPLSCNGPGGSTGKKASRNSDARDPEEKAEVACEAEPTWMSEPMAVKETDVGHFWQTSECRHDCGAFPERKKTGTVGKPDG